jgi:hypothetical protein
MNAGEDNARINRLSLRITSTKVGYHPKCKDVAKAESGTMVNGCPSARITFENTN